ncbi:unnamed protein product [Echinostoma caproni]|uniref:SH3 domain-containing protein n=1 Tax=Echinostoma caproni TaxID=27848 RepID=A0A183AB13_9TREM|nr:unnamed protein product [Echinostoma caproni]
MLVLLINSKYYAPAVMARKEKENLVAKFDYYATESHELTILQGERLTLLDDSLQWWQVLNSQGEVGYVPSNYVRPVKQTLLNNLRNTLTRRKTSNDKLPKHYTPLMPRRYTEKDCVRQTSMPAMSLCETVETPGQNHIENNLRGELTPTKPKGSITPVSATQTKQLDDPVPETPVPISERTEDFYCRVFQTYEAQLADELSIRPGDLLRVYKRSPDGWWFGTLLDRGRPTVTGWFPSNLVYREMPCTTNTFRLRDVSCPATIPKCLNDQVSGNTVSNKCPPTSMVTRETALALYPYRRNHPEELSFQANEILEVIDRPTNQTDWWQCRTGQGEIGWAPRNYLLSLSGTDKKDGLRESNGLTSRSPGKFDQPEPCRSPTYNVDSELLRLAYARRSKLAKLFLAKPWFWGTLSRAECERMLKLFSVPGEFVIRDSESDPGNLTITMNTGKRNRNFKVIVHTNRYHIGYRVFNNLEDLIRYYQAHFIFTDDQQRYLLTQAFVYPGTPELELDRSDYAPTFRPYDAAHVGFTSPGNSIARGRTPPPPPPLPLPLPHYSVAGPNR